MTSNGKLILDAMKAAKKTNKVRIPQPKIPANKPKDMLPKQFADTMPQFEGGGLWDLNKRQWVDSVNNANINKDFVKRFYNQSLGSIQIPGEPGKSTHFMAYDPRSRRVYPEVVNLNGKLVHMSGDDAYNYADDTSEYIEFPTPEQAKWYASSKDTKSGYKMGTGVLGNKVKKGLPKKAKGGSTDLKNPSIVDYLNFKGLPSNKAYRKDLAKTYRVEDYDYSANKNLELLSKLRAEDVDDASIARNQNNASMDAFRQKLMLESGVDPMLEGVSRSQMINPRIDLSTKIPSRYNIPTKQSVVSKQPVVTLPEFSPYPSFGRTPVATKTPVTSIPEFNPYPFTKQPVLAKQSVVSKEPVATIPPFNPYPFTKQLSNLPKKTTAKTAASNLEKNIEEKSWYENLWDAYSTAVKSSPLNFSNPTASAFNPQGAEQITEDINKAARNATINISKFIDPDKGKIVENYFKRKDLKDNPNLKETETKFNIPIINRPAISTGDTINIDKNRYVIPAMIDLNQTNWGVRNRDEYKDINTEAGDITTFQSFENAKNYFSKNPNDAPTSTYIGVDAAGKVKVGNKNDFLNTNYKITKTFSNKIVDFIDEPTGKMKLKNASSKNSNKHLSPVVKVIGDDGNIKEGSLNLLIPKGNKDTKSFGQITGGRVIFKTPKGEQFLVSGSAEDMRNAFKQIKGDNPYVEAITLDNGSYAMGLRNKNQKITAAELKDYQSANTTGSSFLYLQPGNYTRNNNSNLMSKFKDIQITTPNIKAQSDKSFKKGHSLTNSVTNKQILSNYIKANPQDKEFLGKPDVSEIDYKRILDVLKKKGVYEYGGMYDPLMMSKGGYVVTRSHDRKGKTHKVTGPDGTVKYFGDSKLGQHPKDPERKAAFYARHKKNLDNNPFFRAFARKTWEEGGEIPEMEEGGEMIRRADGSYSRRGLWDNIRANKGSGKRPTKEMLEQERKIRLDKKEDGGNLDYIYANSRKDLVPQKVNKKTPFKKVKEPYLVDISRQTAIDQLPYSPYVLAAKGLNEGKPFTGLSELLKLPFGPFGDAIGNIIQENPYGIDIKTLEEKVVPYARLVKGALLGNKTPITKIGEQILRSGETPNSKWYSKEYTLPTLFEAAKSYNIDDNTFTKFIEDNWDNTGGDYKKILEMANKKFSKKQYGGYMEDGGGTPIFTDNPNDPRLKAYTDSLNLYNRGRKAFVGYNSDEYDVKDYKPEKNWGKTKVSKKDIIEAINSTKEMSGYSYGSPENFKERIRLLNKSLNTGIYPTNMIYPQREDPNLIYKKPLQPVIYKKSEPKKEEYKKQKDKQESLTGVQSIVSIPQTNYNQGIPVYAPAPYAGGPGAFVGYETPQGDTVFVKPEDYERMGVPYYGKEFINKNKKQKYGGFLPKAEFGVINNIPVKGEKQPGSLSRADLEKMYALEKRLGTKTPLAEFAKKQQQKEQPYFKQDNRSAREKEIAQQLLAEAYMNEQRGNSPFARTLASYTPMGNNTEAARVAAEQFGEMTPIMSGKRLFQTMSDPKNNPYGISGDAGWKNNLLGSLAYTGDMLDVAVPVAMPFVNATKGASEAFSNSLNPYIKKGVKTFKNTADIPSLPKRLRNAIYSGSTAIYEPFDKTHHSFFNMSPDEVADFIKMEKQNAVPGTLFGDNSMSINATPIYWSQAARDAKKYPIIRTGDFQFTNDFGWKGKRVENAIPKKIKDLYSDDIKQYKELKAELDEQLKQKLIDKDYYNDLINHNSPYRKMLNQLPYQHPDDYAEFLQNYKPVLDNPIKLVNEKTGLNFPMSEINHFYRTPEAFSIKDPNNRVFKILTNSLGEAARGFKDNFLPRDQFYFSPLRHPSSASGTRRSGPPSGSRRSYIPESLESYISDSFGNIPTLNNIFDENNIDPGDMVYHELKQGGSFNNKKQFGGTQLKNNDMYDFYNGGDFMPQMREGGYYDAEGHFRQAQGTGTWSGNAYYEDGGNFYAATPRFIQDTVFDIYKLFGGSTDDQEQMAYGGIHIKPSKRGTFTAAASKHNMGVQAFAKQVLANKENYSPAMVKKANFARNAAKWKHQYGGPVEGEEMDVTPEQLEQLRQQGYQFEILD